MEPVPAQGRPVELVLARQLAMHLSTPVFLVDPEGRLLFYNEPAERVLGLRFDETGEMPAQEWGTRFLPTDAAGVPVPVEHQPLWRALAGGAPTHGTLRIRGLDDVARSLEITALPLVGAGGRTLGAMALFWEQPR